ncbi:hypothetical protein GQ53DRAFT_854057 [Thozetella sp. PMI_491]|nr:hypothetical protein GQ53DRAFT_854057 [Thozetella sp. PMI_491]
MMRTHGCWTCRLRRKKCDGGRPLCSACNALEIECHYADAKPAWMDGGSEQERMAESLKSKIKSMASGRRARHVAQTRGRFVVTSLADFCRRPGSASAESTRDRTPPGAAVDSTIVGLAALRFPSTTDIDEIAPPALSPLSRFANGQDGELALVMRFLDQVFPYLHPFHRSPVCTTGRAFLLVTLAENKIIYLSALSVSTHFFLLAIGSNRTYAVSDCRNRSQHDVGAQINTSFGTVSEQIQYIERLGVDGTVRKRQTAMESVVQLLIFVAAVGNPAGWSLHLGAATTLFQDILTMTGSEEGISMKLAIEERARGCHDSPWESMSAWRPGQVAFRFYAGMLIFIDIIGSTSLQSRPLLLQHHAILLAEGDNGVMESENVAPVQLSLLVGCQNWVLTAIGRTAALDAWKKEMRQAGTLQPLDLATRANLIGDSLRQGLTRLARTRAQEMYLNVSIIPTRIWALAAQAYLDTVASGWRPHSVEIRLIVAEALRLLREVQEPGAMRSFSWPICVLGCLVDTPASEQAFRDLIHGIGDMKGFGSLGEALELMERVWRSRSTLDPGSWDIAA